MSWNCRIMQYKDGSLGIHEVYYEDGEVQGVTLDAVGCHGDDLEDLRLGLEHKLKALDAPILMYEDYNEQNR
jgi:hypothetical protein